MSGIVKKVILQKRDYTKNGTVYSQYRITISGKLVEELGWCKNDELGLVISDKNIIINNIK